MVFDWRYFGQKNTIFNRTVSVMKRRRTRQFRWHIDDWKPPSSQRFVSLRATRFLNCGRSKVFNGWRSSILDNEYIIDAAMFGWQFCSRGGRYSFWDKRMGGILFLLDEI